MSTRLHKFLGYGLKMQLDDADEIADPRINTSSAVFEYEVQGDAQTYSRWLGENGHSKSLDRWFAADAEMLEKHPRRWIEDCYAWSPEGELPDVLVFQPLSMPDWSRYDDVIDAIIEGLAAGDEPFGDHLEQLKHNIYPWSGSYMDTVSGERLDDKVMPWVRSCNDTKIYTDGDREEYAQALGYKDHAEALQRVAPLVPDEIRDLVRYLDVFADEDAWKDLRPMLFTYWS